MGLLKLMLMEQPVMLVRLRRSFEILLAHSLEEFPKHFKAVLWKRQKHLVSF